jgi:UDPglucose 6-dehydrogenase
VVVGVIGLGTVGRATSRMLAGACKVVEFDPAHHDVYPLEALGDCDFAIVCVDTPMAGDGSCDTSNVENAVRRLPVEHVLIKSTVSPGTTDKLIGATGKRICFSPEYLNEHGRGPWGDRPEDVPFLIIGGDPETRTWFMDRMVGLLGADVALFGCSALEAELVKYAENSFLATKVAFVNELYEICGALGANWHTVREGWLLDPRVGRSHSAVFPDDRGFGGKCLPKDVRAIVEAAATAGYRAALLAEVLASNDRFRGPPTDRTR